MSITLLVILLVLAGIVAVGIAVQSARPRVTVIETKSTEEDGDDA